MPLCTERQREESICGESPGFAPPSPVRGSAPQFGHRSVPASTDVPQPAQFSTAAKPATAPSPVRGSAPQSGQPSASALTVVPQLAHLMTAMAAPPRWTRQPYTPPTAREAADERAAVSPVHRQRSRPPSTLTGHRLGDFAHSHRSSGHTRSYATLRSAGEGDDRAAWVTMQEGPQGTLAPAHGRL